MGDDSRHAAASAGRPGSAVFREESTGRLAQRRVRADRRNGGDLPPARAADRRVRRDGRARVGLHDPASRLQRGRAEAASVQDSARVRDRRPRSAARGDRRYLDRHEAQGRHHRRAVRALDSRASAGGRRRPVVDWPRRAGLVPLTSIMRITVPCMLLSWLAAVPLAAQDMEPKAYSASPVGANFFVGGYTWSTGAVVFDPTLPVSDVHADVQAFVVGIGHTFDVFGDLALVSLAMPYATADLTGKVGEQAAAVSRSGLADARMKFSINLLGNPAMAAKDFFRLPRRTVVGASVSVQAPTGQYYDTKLVNIGNNRWGFKPEVGVSVPIRKLDLDAYVGVWLFM